MFDITMMKNDEHDFLEMKGQFTMESVCDFKNAVVDALDSGDRTIVLNMADVKFIDSAAIGAVVHFMESAKKQNQHVMFYDMHPYVKNALSIVINSKYFQDHMIAEA